MHRRQLFQAGVACAAVASFAALAQDRWPARPITCIVPFPTGGRHGHSGPADCAETGPRAANHHRGGEQERRRRQCRYGGSGTRGARWTHHTLVAVEAGVPGFEVVSWHGVFAPAGTPRPMVERLHDEILKILQTSEMQERLNGLGMTSAPMSLDEFAAFQRAEVDKWAKVIKAAGIKAE